MVGALTVGSQLSVHSAEVGLEEYTLLWQRTKRAAIYPAGGFGASLIPEYSYEPTKNLQIDGANYQVM